MLHSSSVATINSAFCSTMTTETLCVLPSSSPISRLMIFRKPRRISFSSSRTSSEAFRCCSFSFSWLEMVSRSARWAWSMWLCHSFCVRRHLDWKAIFTPPPRFMTSAWTIGLSSVRASFNIEWYDMPASDCRSLVWLDLNTDGRCTFRCWSMSMAITIFVSASSSSSSKTPRALPDFRFPTLFKKSRKDGIEPFAALLMGFFSLKSPNEVALKLDWERLYI
mmetsp:Transcript_52820/g.139424  ORF Transcript_52820/g.139424 Transcript_52820/m.139424 type:complete len:222 (+) Transcript_52820:323-988(+)